MTAIKNQSVMRHRHRPTVPTGALSIRRIGHNFLVTAELRSVSSALLTCITAWVISRRRHFAVTEIMPATTDGVAMNLADL